MSPLEKGDHVFFVGATTEAKVTVYQKMTVKFKEALNLPPQFTSELQSQIEVELEEDSEGNLVDDSIFKYTSPTASDKEKNPILMKFKG